MNRRQDMSGIQPGERVGIAVFGTTHHRQLVGEVATVEEGTLEVQLTDPRPHGLAPGALVTLRAAAYPPEQAQVLDAGSGWDARVVLRLLAGMPADRRHELREVMVRPVDMLASVLADGRVAAFRVSVLDFSNGGLGLLAYRRLSPGDRIRLRLGGESESGTVEFAGQVAWEMTFSRCRRAGIQLDALSARQRTVLEEIAAENEREWQRLLEEAEPAGV